MNAWETLRAWPAWRVLEENLREAEALLREADAGAQSSALEVADQIAAMLEDPESLTGYLATRYRLEVKAARPDPPDAEGHDADPGALFCQSLLELARFVSDVPVFLEAGDTSAQLSSLFLTSLPKMWQAQFQRLVAGIRQSMQGMRRRTAHGRPAPAAILPAALAPAVAGAAPSLDQVVGRGGDYHVVLPRGASSDVLEAAHRELAFALLRDLGADAAWLHMLFLARADEGAIPYQTVYRALGLDRLRSMSRREKDERCFRAISRLRSLRLFVYQWSFADQALSYERQAHSLWNLDLLEYGQARMEEKSGAVFARGEDWHIEIASGGWASSSLRERPLDQWRQIAAALTERLDRHRAPFTAPLALWLCYLGRPQQGEPFRVSNGALIESAGVNPSPDERDGLRRSLRAAARAQSEWGWIPDFSDWPVASTGDWEAFLAAATAFARQP